MNLQKSLMSIILQLPIPLRLLILLIIFSTLLLQKCKQEIPFSYKSFPDYLPSTSEHSFFISPCTKEEISDIISTLNNSKSVGPNSIPTRILKTLKNEIFNHLSIDIQHFI